MGSGAGAVSIDKTLQGLIERGDIDAAVGRAGALASSDFEKACLTLLAICCRVGGGVAGGDLRWTDALNDLHNSIAKKEIGFVMVAVAKVGILFQLAMAKKDRGGQGQEPLDILRKRVIGFFEGASGRTALSAAGEECYRHLLPTSDEEERLFAIKLLAGFSKIWAKGDWKASRDSLEYFMRRRLTLSNEMQMPVFLWGALLAFVGGGSGGSGGGVRRRYELYKWAAKRGVILNELLFAGMGMGIDQPVADDTNYWTDTQMQGFHQLFENAGDIIEKHRFIADPMDFVLSHVPTVSAGPATPMLPLLQSASPANIKVLNIKKGRGKKV